jgi:serine/threonine-protein kinase ULK4
LKPSNVLLNEYSTLKLCDFGLARKLQDLANNTKKEEPAAEGEDSKAKSGTPYYMAPELFSDEGVHSF